jgi:hypothetical protein
VTASGHPRSIFKRAIERRNLAVAETVVRELGVVTLSEALDLTALVVERAPGRASRYALRWLRRLLEEDETLTLTEAALAVSCLSALGTRAHTDALATLTAMAERASRQAERRRLASRS